MTYDSTADTQLHISEVRSRVFEICDQLDDRGDKHDKSKLIAPEKEMYDEFTPKLKDSDYGGEEYKGFLVAMGPALEHHYANNDHHPEHFPEGIVGMNLLQMIEMLCDWDAATKRHDSGNLRKSISQINKKRFGYGDDIEALLLNTARDMGWL